MAHLSQFLLLPWIFAKISPRRIFVVSVVKDVVDMRKEGAMENISYRHSSSRRVAGIDEWTSPFPDFRSLNPFSSLLILLPDDNTTTEIPQIFSKTPSKNLKRLRTDFHHSFEVGYCESRKLQVLTPNLPHHKFDAYKASELRVCLTRYVSPIVPCPDPWASWHRSPSRLRSLLRHSRVPRAAHPDISTCMRRESAF